MLVSLIWGSHRLAFQHTLRPYFGSNTFQLHRINLQCVNAFPICMDFYQSNREREREIPLTFYRFPWENEKWIKRLLQSNQKLISRRSDSISLSIYNCRAIHGSSATDVPFGFLFLHRSFFYFWFFGVTLINGIKKSNNHWNSLMKERQREEVTRDFAINI